MNCIVVTPDKTVLDTEATFIALPLYDGEYGVLPGHTPMVGRLGAGELRVKVDASRTENLFIESGFVEVLDDTISLLTGKAIPIDEIDVEEVRQEMDEILAKPAKTPEMVDLREKELAACRVQLRLAQK